jgi:hypothetical protein
MSFLGYQSTKRALGNIVYASAQNGSLPLDTDSVLITLWLRLQFTITTTTTAMVGNKWGGIARLLRQIEVQIEGQDTVISLDGEGAMLHALMDWGTPPQGDATIDLTVTATTYDLMLPISLNMPRSDNPLATALDLRGINQANLVIRWGALTDLVTTVNGGVLSAVTLDVYGEYLDNAPADAPFAVRSLDIQSEGVTGNDSTFNMTQDKGTGLFYRAFNLVTVRDDIAVTTILDGNDIRLVAGNQNFQNWPAELVRGAYKSWGNLATELTNVYPVKIPSLGQLSQMIPTNALDADLRLQMGVTYTSGTEKIINYRESVRPLLF